MAHTAETVTNAVFGVVNASADFGLVSQFKI